MDFTEEMRVRACRFLPVALERAMASYRMITLTHPVNKETKKPDFVEVKRQHEALKVAVGHVRLLMQFAQEIVSGKFGGSDKTGLSQENLAVMLEKAREEMERFDVVF